MIEGQNTEPADVADVAVIQVEADSKPPRWIGKVARSLLESDDLRCCWFKQPTPTLSYSPRTSELDKWKVGDYGVTTRPIGEGTPDFLPTGTYVVVQEVSDRSYTTDGLNTDFPFSGIRVVFEALNPREKQARVCSVRWESLTPSDDIKPVTNEMLVLAIAATGL